MPAKKKAAKKVAKPKSAKVKIVAKGGLQVPIIGKATEAEVTEEQYARLRRIKVNGDHYVERR
jgi:hypothetical protein